MSVTHELLVQVVLMMSSITLPGCLLADDQMRASVRNPSATNCWSQIPRSSYSHAALHVCRAGAAACCSMLASSNSVISECSRLTDD